MMQSAVAHKKSVTIIFSFDYQRLYGPVSTIHQADVNTKNSETKLLMQGQDN